VFTPVSGVRKNKHSGTLPVCSCSSSGRKFLVHGATQGDGTVAGTRGRHRRQWLPLFHPGVT